MMNENTKDKYHILNGKRHREDGPAVEYADGGKEWWFNGKRHRVDGPAIEYSSGNKSWWINDKLHREDGPAIERTDGTKEWWYDGVHHTEKQYNKKINLIFDSIIPDNKIETDQSGNKKYYNAAGKLYRQEWYKDGEFHREDGPAIECIDGKKVRKEWRINGQRHRLDGPAIECANGSKQWFIDGKKYTEEEFNKKINLVPDNTMKINAAGTKVYYNKEGQYHREDGPAIESPNGNKEWYQNGKLHRVDGPAIEWPNGNKYWLIDGYLHRTDGPAIEWVSGKKEWYQNGKLHRLDGPAIENIDGTKYWCIDGLSYIEEQYNKKLNIVSDTTIKIQDTMIKIDDNGNKTYTNKDGQKHREDVPAVEHADGYKEWWINGDVYTMKIDRYGTKSYRNKEGKLHREDGPAIERTDGSKEWLVNGKFHRTDGAAVEFASGNKQWWIDGEKYTEEEYNKKLNIVPDNTMKINADGTKAYYNKEGQYHREDGPAIIWTSGSEEWWVNGKKHRLDGPALESANGNKQWWVSGKLHRKDGPAIEYADGGKSWYFNDKLHRVDGPAVEHINGRKEWWANGKRHRLDGPAIECANGSKQWYIDDKKYTEEQFNKNLNKVPDNKMKIDVDGTKKYYNKYGQHHREDGPAVEYANGDKSWWINDKLHREDGPAVEFANGGKEWFINGIKTATSVNGTKKYLNKDGQLHRVDGPAIEYSNGTKEWHINGKRHRIDGPAIEYSNGSKLWYQNGKLHREDGPAIESANGGKSWYIDGIMYSEKQFNEKLNLVTNNTMVINADRSKRYYNKEGKLHREDGPAIEKTDGSKEWYLNGIQTATSVNGIKKYFNKGGQLHREDAPAIEYYDGSKFWYINDRLHREDGPAIEYANGDKHWYINGKRHRIDGPACEYPDGDKYWYINDLKYTEEEYNKKLNIITNDVISNKSALQKIHDHPTVLVGINAFDNAIKLTSARQASRLLASFISTIVTELLIKLGYKEYIPLLETDLGKALLEISAPTLIHMAVNHGIIPENKYNTYIETVSRLSLDANIAFYAMKYSDQALDMFTALATDPKTRENVGAIVKLGMALNQSDKGDSSILEGLLMPDLSSLDDLINNSMPNKVKVNA